MHRYHLLVLSVTFFASTLTHASSIEDEMKIIAANLRENLLQIAPTQSADQLVKSQNPDGSWTDIPYDSNVRSPWKPMDHTERLLVIAKAGSGKEWKMPDCQPYSDAIVRGLQFWFTRKPVSLNWWYQTIGVPMSLAPASLLSWGQIPEPMKQTIIQSLTEAGEKQEKWTGTNRAWIANNNLVLSLLTKNEALLMLALNALTEELRVTTAEGLQPDWSFHQHGAMLQTGNYGNAFLSTQITLAKLLKGTRWEIPADKIALLTNYSLEHSTWPIWGKYYDVSACGRQMDGVNSLAAKARGAANAAKRLSEVDAKAAEPLKKVHERWSRGDNEGGPVGARYWWRSEYFITRQPSWTISLKLCSSRVMRVETVVNDENKIGLFLNDGATWIRVRGDEQENLQPLLDWRRIPGITGLDISDPVPPKVNEKTSPANGSNSWVGGCTSGNRGVVAMDYKNATLTAKKSWYFFSWGMVCLGMDIKDEAGGAAFTAVNQGFLKKPFFIFDTGEKECPAEFAGELAGAWHDGVAYAFSPKQKIRIFNGKRSGLWTDMKTLGSPKEPAVGEVFQINLSHSGNTAYEYAVLPAVAKESLKSIVQKPVWKILANQSTAQAVEEENGAACGITFWKPGTVKTALGNISVDQPCLILVEGDANSRQITLADPSHSLTSVTVDISGAWKGENTMQEKGNTKIKVTLPSGGMAGSNVAIKLSR